MIAQSVLRLVTCVLCLAVLVCSQNDGQIHTDLIMGNYDPLLDRQNDGLIHTDLIMGNYDLAGDPLSDREQKTEDRAFDREQATLYHYKDRDEASDRELNTCECAAAPTGADRIVGGSTVDPKYKYPYTAYFQANGYMCGGTILNKRYVLTAMHCLYSQQGVEHPPSGCSVVLGEHNLSDGQNEGGQVIGVEAFVKRDDYDFSSNNPANDIALLRLAEDITFTDKVKPACMPTDAGKTYANRWAAVTGWGGTVGYNPGEDVNQVSSTSALKETSLKILDGNEASCRAMTRGDSQTMLCAFSEGTDSCQGDSGGPLTVVENGKYTVVGVVSVGLGCASSYPGIYARVTNYIQWIRDNTASGDCSDTTTTTTTTSSCNFVDRYPDWCTRNKAYCTNAQWGSWFEGHCPKTCKCSSTPTCDYTDKQSWCSSYKNYCNYSFIQSNCQKTCNC